MLKLCDIKTIKVGRVSKEEIKEPYCFAGLWLPVKEKKKKKTTNKMEPVYHVVLIIPCLVLSICLFKDIVLIRQFYFCHFFIIRWSMYQDKQQSKKSRNCDECVLYAYCVPETFCFLFTFLSQGELWSCSHFTDKYRLKLRGSKEPLYELVLATTRYVQACQLWFKFYTSFSCVNFPV